MKKFQSISFAVSVALLAFPGVGHSRLSYEQQQSYWFGFIWGVMSGVCMTYQDGHLPYSEAKNYMKEALALGENKVPELANAFSKFGDEEDSRECKGLLY